METKQKILIQLDELRKAMLNENSPTGARICKEAQDYISNRFEQQVNATLAEDDKIKQAGFEILNANIENRIERFEMFTPAFDETVMCYFVWIKQKP